MLFCLHLSSSNRATNRQLPHSLGYIFSSIINLCSKQMEKIVLAVLVVVFVTFMDLSSQGKFKLSKLNMKDTWKNKWKNGDPKQGEKFFLSSTTLVWLTDFFHLVKFLFMVSLSTLLTICLGFGFVGFLVIIIAWGILFEILYRLLGNTK